MTHPTRQHRFGIMLKNVLRTPTGWRSYDSLIVEICSRSVTRYELQRKTGLLAPEIDSIVDRLQSAGRVERNRRLTGGRPIVRYEAPGRGDVFWGVRAA
jgi:hypothetical protein